MFWLRMGKNLGLVSRTQFEELIITKPIEKSGLFDKKWYLAQYPDVKDAQIDPVKHYLETGWKQGYNPSPRFDNNKYLSMYPDVADARICPLLHYIKFGYNEGRLPKLDAQKQKQSGSLSEKIQNILDYPARVQNEYIDLKQEIEELKKHK